MCCRSSDGEKLPHEVHKGSSLHLPPLAWSDSGMTLGRVLIPDIMTPPFPGFWPALFCSGDIYAGASQQSCTDTSTEHPTLTTVPLHYILHTPDKPM